MEDRQGWQAESRRRNEEEVQRGNKDRRTWRAVTQPQRKKESKMYRSKEDKKPRGKGRRARNKPSKAGHL